MREESLGQNGRMERVISVNRRQFLGCAGILILFVRIWRLARGQALQPILTPSSTSEKMVGHLLYRQIRWPRD
jgi:hypothetical protein